MCACTSLKAKLIWCGSSWMWNSTGTSSAAERGAVRQASAIAAQRAS